MKVMKKWLLTMSLFAISAQVLAANVDIKEANSPLYLNLSGWMNKGLLVKKRVNLNKATERSPNPKEFNSPEDSFKINYAFFLNDPEFKCRRPSFYAYFSRLTNETPHANSTCKRNSLVTLISESTNGANPIVARNIDASRIYQIHYLFAGKGKQMMSRWGHAMYRIVLCAPGRAVGPDCLQDYSNHIVVSYRANVEDMNIDYAKGMNGAYASQLFLMNMSEVVAEYTKGEFRDIISLPLKMDRGQIALFTDKLLENYWSYKGQYYFITNNCATEAMNLLRTAFPDNKKMQTVNIVTPLGLYDYLIKNKITDADILNDKKQAIKLGYLFEGVSEKLQNSLNLFAADKGISFEDFALKLTPAERLAIYEEKLSTSNQVVTLMANALRLEEQILLSREQQFAKKIGNALFGKEPMPELKETILDEKIIAMKDLYKKLSAESYLAKGYGIPLADEFVLANPESIKALQAEIKNNMEELKEISIKFFPKEVEEMRGTIENRHWILTKINETK